jgi:uncharacterized protein
VFNAGLFLIAVFAGATASVVGFGIGSLLTPLFALEVGTSVAVAAVTVPHALATAVRCWRLRRQVDRAVLRRFGVLSAAGARAGGLLILTALAQLSGWTRHWQPKGPLVGVFGVISGFFGGVAGNQGGLRAAALTAFHLSPSAFVATATAAGLMVDAARTPIYLWQAGPRLAELWAPIAIAAAGVLLGTIIGERILLGLPPKRFARIVGGAIGVLGLWLIYTALATGTS